ncbi:SEA (Seh1-associated) complex subunit [Orbilia oligospora]|uniref:SEA (Seh1-associated) complex subunit n=1 Tax=Orbilia oligospora TaxID=2813651 RepID=A0A6G1MQ59_ORBOL|nr:SEA (Seh1-associated) complex subunit [Orbilia oligospora]KAF3265663.1 SEA (Seh1-associated) complex subunit [Orbilia oligospora]
MDAFVAPQHFNNRAVGAAAAVRRFIGGGTSRPSTSAGPPSLAHSTSNLGSYHGSRTARYDLQVPIQSLSASPDQDLVVVAGREVLKVLRVTFHGDITERLDLRAGNAPGKTVANSDVKWGCNFSKDVIATANTNGNICVYDLGRGGKLDRVMHEHQRSVHKIAFNPGNGKILISGSQDGMMKIWDLRQKKSTMTLWGKSDAVRDVQFNALNAVHFAAAFDNGTIQKWEWRMGGTAHSYLKKISAHNGPVFSIDWHPDGKYVASGGRDKTVKVWDFGEGDTQNKRPVHTISTMAAIGRATWRPRGVSTREIATCAMTHDNRITVWDIKRPFVGKYAFDEHTNATSGLLWKDENTLWSCSKDQMFVQHDLSYAVNPINSLNHSAVAWAPNLSFIVVMGQRPPPPAKRDRNVRFEMDDEISGGGGRKKSSVSAAAGRVHPKIGTQQSGIDTLGAKYAPQQAVVEVALPMFSGVPFTVMATNWVTSLSDGMTLSQACQKNAETAWVLGQYRTAQTWKMLDLIQGWEIEARQEEEERLNKEAEMASSKSHLESGIFAKRALGVTNTDRKSSNGSAVATPLAKPVADTPQLQPILTPTPKAPTNPPGNIDENLSLPPKAFGTSVSSSTASTDGGEILNMASRRVSVIARSPQAIDENKELSLKPVDHHHRHENEDKITPLRSDIFSATPEVTFRGNNDKNGATHDPEVPDVAASSSFDKDRDKASLAYRGRQYSIGLTSEQTSSSYDDSTNSFGHRPRLGNSHPFHKETSDDEDDDDHHHHNHNSTRHHNQTTHHNPSAPLNPAMRNTSSHNLKHQHQLNTAEVLGKDIQDMVKDYGTIKLSGSGYGRMKELPWNLQNFLTVLTDYYSDRGEVQMCATLALLFGDLVVFDERRMGDWIEGYVEQLQRFKLYVPAAEVIKATTVEHVRSQALTNTFIHLSCGNCNAPMMSGGGGVGAAGINNAALDPSTSTILQGDADARRASYKGSLYCESCRRMADGCMLCHQIVRGRWTMCQGCCHGGHDDCLRGWYVDSKMKQCPSGCGHDCV